MGRQPGLGLGARVEAARDGAPPIDLVDGDRLTEKLKELRLGVNIQMIEKVDVDSSWFASICWSLWLATTDREHVRGGPLCREAAIIRRQGQSAATAVWR